jgi:hypothetical protein
MEADATEEPAQDDPQIASNSAEAQTATDFLLIGRESTAVKTPKGLHPWR